MTISLRVMNRKSVRKAFAAFLSSNLAVPGGPAQVVYSYQLDSFKGGGDVDPGDEVKDVTVIVVTSDGSENRLEDENVVYINTHSFALYSRDEWTEEMSEDAIDDLEQGIMDVATYYSDRRAEGNPEWIYLELVQRSEVDIVPIEGLDYRHEYFTFRFTVANTG